METRSEKSVAGRTLT